MHYLDTRIENLQDSLAGVSFPDPYRWLEQDTEEVLHWQREQAELASSHVREWPEFDRLRNLVAHYGVERQVALPRYASGSWFRAQIASEGSQVQIICADTPMGEGRVLFDSLSAKAERPPFASWISPSPDGRVLAVGLCANGSERNTILLIDVRSGERLADPPQQMLMDGLTGGAQWLADSSGFFFTALRGDAASFNQQVYLHRRFPTPTTTHVDIPWTGGAHEYRMVVVSRDGRRAVALEHMNSVIPVAVAALDTEPLNWRPFVTSFNGTLAGHVVGEHYIAITDADAPRGRLVAIPLDAKDPNDTKSWHQLVGESDVVMRTVTPVTGVLYLTEFVDTYARVRMVASDGRTLGELPLPGRGAISESFFPLGNLAARAHPDEYLFAFSSLTESWGIYSHVPGAGVLKTLREPQRRLESAVVEDHWVVSVDGSRIPYHTVRRSDIDAARPQPTLIYAYGGFNVPLVPQFPSMMAAFVAAGGVFVHAHLRGGGEFGLDWWRSGRFSNKQNCYNDLYRVAEDLISKKTCTPRTLAVTGRSNGGLMAGVALTQRPDLWAVVVPRVPRLDLIGACRSSYGRRSTLEDRASDLDDPDEARRLATFSPYHLVREGVQYPAVFIEAGDIDPRCPPQDARKFAARLQAASIGSAPILLHIWENVGHGMSIDRNTEVAQYAEWLAFTLRHLGVHRLVDVGASAHG